MEKICVHVRESIQQLHLISLKYHTFELVQISNKLFSHSGYSQELKPTEPAKFQINSLKSNWLFKNWMRIEMKILCQFSSIYHFEIKDSYIEWDTMRIKFILVHIIYETYHLFSHLGTKNKTKLKRQLTLQYSSDIKPDP